MGIEDQFVEYLPPKFETNYTLGFRELMKVYEIADKARCNYSKQKAKLN